MGRIADAYRTLVGRTDHQIRASAQMARIEAHWHTICAEIADTLEILNRVDDRLRKREERAKKPKKSDPPAPQTLPEGEPATVGRQDVKAYKAQLRRRYAGHRHPLAAGNGNPVPEMEEAP